MWLSAELSVMVSFPGQLDEAEISGERVLGLTEKRRPTVDGRHPSIGRVVGCIKGESG